MPRTVDITAWVRKAINNPVAHRQRQVTEIILNAVSLTPSLRANLYLKGGILMDLAFGSLRTTSDVDFTTEADPLAFATQLRDALDKGMARAAAELGYTDFVCRVQMVKQRPAEFHEANFPALKVKVAYAQRGSNEERRLLQGYGTQVLSMDMSL